MYTIRVRRKHKVFIVSLFFCMIFVYYVGRWLVATITEVYMLDDKKEGPCNRQLMWTKPAQPVIGLLGAPESGVLWLRFLVEQMSGLYTGSVDTHLGPAGNFRANGHSEKVVAVMAYDMHKIEGMQAAVVLYRNMKDTIRAQYAFHHGNGAFLEAPLRAYYGSDWPKFAVEAAKQWVEAHQVYLEASVPLLIMTYEEIHDAAQLRRQLLLISNFLHIAMRSSVFECILKKFDAFEATPRPLKEGFQPFELLPTETRMELEKMEKNIATQILEMREKYRPKV